jgi:hypothetical protein
VRRSPLGFGWLIKRRPLDSELLASWLRPSLEDPAVRRGINSYRGGVPHAAVAEALGVAHTPLPESLGTR